MVVWIYFKVELKGSAGTVNKVMIQKYIWKEGLSGVYRKETAFVSLVTLIYQIVAQPSRNSASELGTFCVIYYLSERTNKKEQSNIFSIKICTCN